MHTGETIPMSVDQLRRQSSKKGPLPSKSWTKSGGGKGQQVKHNKTGQKVNGRFGRAAFAAGQVGLAVPLPDQCSSCHSSS